MESDPQNKLYFDVWAPKEGHPAATQRGERNGNGDGSNDAAIKELAGLVKLAFGDKRKDEADGITKSLITWALEQKDKELADSSPSAVASLVKELKGILPTQPASSNDPLAIVDKVLSIQSRGETDVEKVWKLVERVQGGHSEEP